MSQVILRYSAKSFCSRFFEFRVVAKGDVKDVSGHTFHGFGGHTDHYPCSYLTAAAAIGMQKHDVDLFIKRLDKVLSKLKPGSKSKDDISGDVLNGIDNLEINEGHQNGASANVEQVQVAAVPNLPKRTILENL